MILKSSTEETRMRRQLLRLAAAAAIGLGSCLFAAVPSWTQSFPDRPIRFFVSIPAGGSTDAVARAMQPALEKILGQPVVVENRLAPAARWRRRGRQGAPDGYTIGIAGAGALGVNIGERTKADVRSVQGLGSHHRAAESPFILVATPALNAKTLADVIKLAKAEPNPHVHRPRAQRHGDATTPP